MKKMANPIGILTTQKILKLRNYLQQISHISFSFAKINRDYPLEGISEKQAKELIEVYENLLKEAKKIINLIG